MKNNLFDDFEAPLEPTSYVLKDAILHYLPAYYDTATSDNFLATLLHETPWHQDEITMFGKRLKTPRLSAYYGDKSYAYSGIQLLPHPFTPLLNELKSTVEKLANSSFNAVLLNRYRDGKDSMGWHADDEAVLGQNPVIASVNFGASRRFMLRHKTERQLKTEFNLGHGAILIMSGATQHHWQHQVPKTNQCFEERVNLTFRKIV
jgi:alkylated DNA repair dioxygenase AlkB